MMRKAITMFLITLIFVLGLCGCSDGSQPADEPTADPTAKVTDMITPTPTPTISVTMSNNVGIYDKDKAQMLKYAKVGEYVCFGEYEQDNDHTNGKEEIEWLVLDKKDGRALVISKYALDRMPLNDIHADVTWETCTLRRWLNNEFLNNAFSYREKAMIPIVTVPAHKNPHSSIHPGKATQDRVFILSLVEAVTFFDSNNARRCMGTEYAVAKGVMGDYCWWWLRSPGQPSQASAIFVIQDGDYNMHGWRNDLNYEHGVRPAMWIDYSN